MTVQLREGERLDDLQNGYKIIQDKSEFCFGIDAVLLAWFAKVKQNEQVLDMCCGTGIVPLLMRGRYNEGHYTGLEIQPKSAKIARRNMIYNQVEDVICIKNGDVKEATTVLGGALFNVVTCNPPYMTGNHGLTNLNDSKAIARHEIMCNLEDVIAQTAKVLKVKGRFYMIHRPFRLAEIMVLMSKYKLEPKRMRMVYPFVDKEPTMVLIEGLLGGRPRITVEKPLIVYQQPGQYTKEVMDIYDNSSQKEHNDEG
jgi:Predicted O-methyltransferase